MNTYMEDLSQYKGLIPQETVLEIAGKYSLREPQDMRPGGGTASPKVILQCEDGFFLMRRRRSEFCPENCVLFDHAFIRHLAEAGLPVASPLVARDGRTWVVEGEHTYEIVPFIKGLALGEPNSTTQMVSAAKMLSRLHKASQSFSPPTVKDLGRDLYLPRYLDLIEEQLSLNVPHNAPFRALGERMLKMAKQVIVDSERLRPDELLPIAVHGDYTWANVMYRGEEVGGIFDFDWTTRTNRVWDVARGILFFAFRRHSRFNPDDITSLAEAMIPDYERASVFLKAYTEGMLPLNDEEQRILPLFIRETLLCMRIAGMRKLPTEQRLAYATREMEPLLDWMETSLESFDPACSEEGLGVLLKGGVCPWRWKEK